MPRSRGHVYKTKAALPRESIMFRDNGTDMNMTTYKHEEDNIVEDWAFTLSELLGHGNFPAAASLFAADGYLRDLVALTWHFHTYRGHSRIEKALRAAASQTKPQHFRLAGPDITKRKRKVDGTTVIETILDFDTEEGTGKAVLRLVRNARGSYEAWVLATALHGLTGHPERVGPNRPIGTPSLDTFGGKNWLDRRREELAYDDRDPDVLVVGAGQSGLAFAARLRALGVDALVVDRLPNVGDVWRNRYHTLTLHNAIWLNHLPYIPFPDTWPVYIPKDKLANWFECYAEAMELNIWTSAELVEATYDDAEQRWTAKVERSDNAIRSLRPAHIVMATGASGIPYWPDIPGMDSFRGTLVHSADFRGGSSEGVMRAVVFGSGNSGHDVAQDLYANGNCHVTVVQRNPTTVVDISTVHEVYDRFSTRLSPDHADLMLVATPYDLAVDAFRSMTRKAKERDSELIAKLQSVGFRTDYGEDETGHRMKYLRRGGGYYINVGCSDLIAARSIDLLQYEQIDRIVENGVRQIDGSILEADLIVMATGYENQQALVKQIFGTEVADHVGPIWGYDAEGELRGMYKRTGQPGLWFHAGSLTQSRVYSRLIALQIKACLEGLIEPNLREPAT
jgi:cation diffusion facilitator CzcD-associated flavoprotein CzcO